MEKIVYSNQVTHFFENLIFTLLQDNYFSFEESAYNYVDNLRAEIESGLYFKQAKLSPDSLVHHGQFYLSIKFNKHTTWYIFFNKFNNAFNINYIFNNHSEDAQFLNLR
jgi:hypothetical protein